MSVRPDMQALASRLGTPFSEPGAQYTVREILGPYLYRVYREIANREHSSVVAVIRDVLRKNCEGVS